MCSLFDAREARARKGEVFANVSAGADAKANTSDGGAHEVSDLRLLEDGSERSGALGSDVVAPETAREG
eukprot:scaffold24012_cov53-Phaeocystis_antarctica.AAC.1